MTPLADWLRDRRARAVVVEADDVVAMVSVKTGTVHLYPGHSGIDAEVIELRPRVVTRRCRCGAWFWDRHRNDSCAVCRSMPDGAA